MKNIIILLGAPCSGKSTIGKKVASEINAYYISSGDIARQMAQTNEGINEDLNNGKLAPEEMMREKILCNIMNCDNDVVILDGFPRFGEQAEWLNDIFCHTTIRYVLTYAPMSILIDRACIRKRADDANYDTRLKYFYSVTMEQLGKYVDIVLDTYELTEDMCVNKLTKYIKEVLNANC